MVNILLLIVEKYCSTSFGGFFFHLKKVKNSPINGLLVSTYCEKLVLSSSLLVQRTDIIRLLKSREQCQAKWVNSSLFFVAYFVMYLISDFSLEPFDGAAQRFLPFDLLERAGAAVTDAQQGLAQPRRRVVLHDARRALGTQ